jgi:acetyl-CoA C-acetyltransferase
VCTYALIESALRADAGTARDVHLRMIAGLWSRLSAVASENPFAWIRREFTPEQIATPTAENRLGARPWAPRAFRQSLAALRLRVPGHGVEVSMDA